jgi:RNA-binding protein YhbY
MYSNLKVKVKVANEGLDSKILKEIAKIGPMLEV